MMNKRSRGKILSIVLIVLLVVAIVASVASYVYGKYRTEVLLTGTARKTSLAGSFTLQMQEMMMEEDGSYTAGDAAVTEQTNYLIPGTAIPQSPVITIQGKTDVPCYLYLEVLADNEEEKASCALTDDWTLLENVRGLKGGEVYVYQKGEKLTSSVGAVFTTQVLRDGISAERIPAEKAAELSFCGYLIQVTEGSPAEVFTQKLNENG